MTDDLIRRSDAIEWLKEACKAGDIDPYTSNQRKCDFEEAINCIEEIPTAEPKHGEWISLHNGKWKYSECEIEILIYAKGNFCPNCDADIKVVKR